MDKRLESFIDYLQKSTRDYVISWSIDEDNVVDEVRLATINTATGEIKLKMVAENVGCTGTFGKYTLFIYVYWNRPKRPQPIFKFKKPDEEKTYDKVCECVFDSINTDSTTYTYLRSLWSTIMKVEEERNKKMQKLAEEYTLRAVDKFLTEVGFNE